MGRISTVNDDRAIHPERPVNQRPADHALIETIKRGLNEYNPVRSGRLQPDATINWSSMGVCNSRDIVELAEVAAEHGRFMHINTSAHGCSRLAEDEFFEVKNCLFMLFSDEILPLLLIKHVNFQ